MVLLQACLDSPALLALLVVAVSGRNADIEATTHLTVTIQVPHLSPADSLLLPVSRALLAASLLTASSLLPAAARLASTPVLDDRMYNCMSIRLGQGSAIGFMIPLLQARYGYAVDQETWVREFMRFKSGVRVKMYFVLFTHLTICITSAVHDYVTV